MLEGAVPFYRGEFLEGFYIDRVEEFEEWVFYKRERYRRIYQKMLEVVVQQLSLVGEYEEALDYTLKALRQDPLSEEYHSMAMMLYWKVGDKQGAIRQYKSYRDAVGERLGLEPPSEMRDLFYKMVAQFPNASVPKELSEMVTVPVEDELKGNLFERQGLTLFDISQYGGAFREFERALSHAEKTGNLRLKCRCLYQMGMAKLWGHEVDAAEQYLTAGYELGKSIQDEQTVIGCAVNLALVFGLKGDLDESRRLSEEALRRKDMALDSRSRYEILMDVSRRFLWKGNPKSALHGFKEALKLSQEKGRKADAILSHLFLGLAYASEGSLSKALDNLHNGYQKAKEIGNTFLLSKLLNSIGWVYQELGDFVSALSWDQAAANLARDNGWPEPLGYSLINLGLDHLYLDNLFLAQDTLEEAEGVADRSTYKWRWLGALWLAKAEAAFAQGDIGSAQTALIKAGGMNGQVRGQKHMARLEILKGRLQIALGQAERAEAHFLKAVALADNSGNPLVVIDSCNAAARFFADSQHQEVALTYLERSKACVEQVAAHLEGSLKDSFLKSPRAQAVEDVPEQEKGGKMPWIG